MLLTMFMSMVGVRASAHDFAVENSDGVTIYYRYNSDGTSVSVTYRGFSSTNYSNEYSGKVTIPDTVTFNKTKYNVTSIGDYAFYGCSDLTSITIPCGVTSIGYDAFEGCSGITEIVWNAENYSNVSFPGPFYDIRTQITNFTIGNKVTIIPGNLCNGMSNLKCINIPANVKKIEEEAFSCCSGLTSVTISDSVTSIGNYAFANCSGLTSVTIPNGVTNMGNQVFSGCSGITDIVWNAENCSNFSFPGPFDNIRTQIINFTIGNKVTIIPDYLCYEMRNLKYTIIPANVMGIGDFAFSGCSGLTSVEISNSVTSIGNYAFCDCSSLTSLTIPNNLTDISDFAFFGCSGLTSVAIPNSVTSISSFAFSGCSGLTTLTIPASVTSISNSAFEGCSGLMEFVLDQNNQTFWSKDGVIYKENTLAAFPYGKEGKYFVPDNVVDVSVLFPVYVSSYYGKGVHKLSVVVLGEKTIMQRMDSSSPYFTISGENLEYFVIKNPYNCLYKYNFYGYEYNGNKFKGFIVPEECCESFRTKLLSNSNYSQVLPLYPADITFYHKVSAEEYANALKDKDEASITSVALYGGMDSTLTVADIKSGMNPNCLYYINDNTATDDLQDNVIQLSDLTANNIKLVDGYNFNCPGYFQARKAQYTHTPSLWANGTQGWETICLPYDASVFKASKSGFVSPIVANSYGNFWLREFVGASSKALFFAPTQNGVVEAGKPYIIAFPGNSMGSGSLQGETISFIGRDVEFNADNAPRVQRNNYIFVGNYDNVQDEGDGLILNSTGASFVSSSAVGNKPFTAYFKTEDESAYAKSMAICLDGIEEEETAIGNISSDKAEITAIGNGTVVISSAQSGTAVIRSINGATMRNVTIKAGDNRISGLPRGLYIINNQKILVE